MAPSFLSFLHSQLFVSLPSPTASLTGKTAIVTGSNVGLGKEAARHIARLGASTVILAVRDVQKGEEAKRDIDQSTGCAKDVVRVWQLDMANYQSVKDFAARAERELSRLDLVLLNAGVAKLKYSTAEDNELTITVNVVSTFLLAFLLLPKLKDTARRPATRTNLTITTSEMHSYAKFQERNAPEGQIFKTLNEERSADMAERYAVSKLLEVFGVREMAERVPADAHPVTINCVNPGMCHSELARDAGWGLYFMKLFLARTTEYGSRTLVHAATQGPETHGCYLSDCRVADPSPLVLSEEGKAAQEKVWKELVGKLEGIRPGITANL